ncbi:MAG: ABC transporter ATP-binding protein [Patescibacteria group bacterium]
MLTAKNLTKKFESGTSELIALNNVSISVQEGEFVAITGKSGSGKSTLLYQLGLLDKPTSGEIFLNNKNVTNIDDDARTRIRLRELGYVFQDYATLPALTALENVMLPLLMLGEDKAQATKLATKALESVGLGPRLHNLPSQLSGGEQQRVSIARAIGHDPAILFADEPTANLDSATSQMVLDAFLELHRDGQTIIMVTHEPEYAKLANRVIHLTDGQITV